MAERTPRTPPKRVRGRVSVPSVASIKGPPRVSGIKQPGMEFERTFLTPSPAAPGGANSAAAGAASLNRSPSFQIAMEELRDGDDTFLLPYQPTPSINPPRPRTLAAGYDSQSKTLRIRFRNGQIYEYYNVPSNVWRNFRRVQSPGRMVNRVLNSYPYAELHV